MELGQAFSTSYGFIANSLGGSVPDLSSFDNIKNNPWALIGMLIVALTTAGFGEEVIWRGFFLKQIARLFDGNKSGWLIGLIISSVVFGLIHAYQGITGILVTGLPGIIFGTIFILSGRNLWTSIIAHVATEIIGFILIYNWENINYMILPK